MSKKVLTRPFGTCYPLGMKRQGTLSSISLRPVVGLVAAVLFVFIAGPRAVAQTDLPDEWLSWAGDGSVSAGDGGRPAGNRPLRAGETAGRIGEIVGGPSRSTAAGGADDEGACVLLRNDQVIFGAVEQQGEWVIVRNGSGNRIRLPRSEVASWAESVRELFQAKLAQRRGGDPQVHLRDARWCLRHGLYDLAAAELSAVHQIFPGHPEASVLERRLRAVASQASAVDPEDGFTDIALVTFEGDTASERSPDTLGREAGPLAVDAASFQHFVRSVQPLLLNRCGNCHSHTSEREWRLIVPPPRARASARITHENLHSLLPWIRLGDPASSELIRWASQAHGGGGAPLKAADHRAMAGLQMWVRDARPAFAAAEGMAIPRRPARPATTNPPPAGTRAMDVTAGSPVAEFAPHPPAAALVAPPSVDTTPSRLPPVDNPFDPELFNRRYHGDN